MTRAPDAATNIGERGARRRRRTGAIWGAVAIVLAIVLVVLRAPAWYAIAFGVAIAMCAWGFLQARERT